MDTYNGTYSDSPYYSASPILSRLQLGVDAPIEAPPEYEKAQSPRSSGLQEGDLFYDSLIISGGKSRPRNLRAVVASVTLVSLLLLALVVIPLFHTETLPTRKRLTMLYLPPAGAASNASSLSVPTSAFESTPTRITPTKLSIPRAVHMTKEAPSPAVVTEGGVVGGVPGGVVGGVPGGVLSGMLRSNGTAPVLASTPAPAPKRIRVPAPAAEANLVYDVAPKYPPEAGRERIEGTVVLMAVIGKDGTVRDVQVESGLPVLAQAAMDAVRQWRYRPYLLNGEPVEIDSKITINFNLSRG